MQRVHIRKQLHSLFDFGCLAKTIPQVVQLCSAHLAPANRLHLHHPGAVNREHFLAAHAVRNPANGDGLPDAAMLTVLDKIDMVFIGAETFYPDGTAFNTVGSDILAELCLVHHVPYYVLTPLLKGDIRALYGIYKETLTKDLRETMAAAWPEELRAQVDFTSVELVGVAPEFITGYVTEKGILRTGDLLRFIYEEDQNA